MQMLKTVHPKAQISAGSPIGSPKNDSGARNGIGVFNFFRSSWENDASPKSIIFTGLVRIFSPKLQKYAGGTA